MICFGCSTALVPSRCRLGLFCTVCHVCGLLMFTTARQRAELPIVELRMKVADLHRRMLAAPLGSRERRFLRRAYRRALATLEGRA